MTHEPRYKLLIGPYVVGYYGTKHGALEAVRELERRARYRLQHQPHTVITPAYDSSLYHYIHKGLAEITLTTLDDVGTHVIKAAGAVEETDTWFWSRVTY